MSSTAALSVPMQSREQLQQFAYFALGAQQCDSLYPAEHPRTRRSIRNLYLHTAEILRETHEIRIALADGELIYDRHAMPANNDLLKGFAKLLSTAGVSRLVIMRGVRQWEIEGFIRHINSDPNEIMRVEDLQSALACDGIEHIEVGHLALGGTERGGSGFGGGGVGTGDALPSAWEVYSAGLEASRWIRSAAREGLSRDHVHAARKFAASLVEVASHQTDALLMLHSLKVHDQYSYTHSVNVAMLSLAIAQGLELPPATLREIALAALLHDIGKELVPPKVLNKPGKLTEEEWEVMQRHSPDGAKLLLAAPDLGDLAMVVAYEHQIAYEVDNPDRGKWPLHFVSEIVCIADVYDALRSHRPYRRALSPEDSMRIMEEEAEQKFDTALFEGFRRMFGYWPPGTCVELNNGAIAVSSHANPDDPARPRILVVRDPKGNELERPVPLELVDLDDEYAGFQIKKTVDGDEIGVEPLDYL